MNTDRFVLVKDRLYKGDRAVTTWYVYDETRKCRLGLGHTRKADAKRAAHYLNQTAAG